MRQGPFCPQNKAGGRVRRVHCHGPESAGNAERTGLWGNSGGNRYQSDHAGSAGGDAGYKNKTFKQDTLRYLSGLQLMALVIQPAALLAYDAIDGAARRRLGRQLRACEGIPLELLLQCVMEFQPLEPLRTILKEINKLLHWGYYFALLQRRARKRRTVDAKSLDAFDCLQKNDKQGFANTLAGCYCHILAFVRDHMVRCGLAGGENCDRQTCLLWADNAGNCGQKGPV